MVTGFFRSATFLSLYKLCILAHIALGIAFDRSNNLYNVAVFGYNGGKFTLDMDSQAADLEKERGNQCFKKGDYSGAVDHYTLGIHTYSRQPMLFGNRAMALLKLGRIKEAIEDCSEALRLDNTYVKAYYRRATAYLRICRYDLAEIDFSAVAQLEPNNREARKELDAILKCKVSDENGEFGYKLVPSKYPTEKKPLRRVAVKCDSGTASKTEAKDKSPIVTSMDTSGSNIHAAENSSISHAKIEQLSPRTKHKSKPETSMHASSSSDNIKTKFSTDAKVSEITEPVNIPEIPQSRYRFVADFASLEGHPLQLAEYFLRIPVSSYTQLFQESLDQHTLQTILSALVKFVDTANNPSKYDAQQTGIYSQSDISDVLLGIAHLSRFKIVAMFMGDKEKRDVEYLLTSCSEEKKVKIRERFL